MICRDCKGKGYTVFLGNESDCRSCGGDGEMVVCESFSHPPGVPVVFKNQPCFRCGVRENDHTAQLTQTQVM